MRTHWIWWVLNPGDFDEDKAPPPPNYTLESSWAALPTKRDGSDVAIKELPGRGDEPRAQVFYLHPTTWLGRSWNGPVDAEVVRNTHDGGTLIQASVFNACCEVWGPYYRQANGRAFTHPDADGARAIERAYADVERAFDYFIGAIGRAPFIVAGHSQGSVHGERLLRERVSGAALQEQLVAAYLLGGTVTEESSGLPLCADEDDTGCLVAWNVRGPGYEPKGLEFNAEREDTMSCRACVNPLSWSDPEAHVGREGHSGALFLDAKTPKVRPAFSDAQCVDGVLVITEHDDLERDLAGRALMRMMGPENYHPVEYQLFFVDLRENAERRVDAWHRQAVPSLPL